MQKLSVKKLLFGFCCFFITQVVLAQTKVSGTITDAVTKEPLIGVSVQVKGKVIGTITDTKGNFSFSTSTPPPFTLLITSVGYESQEVSVSGNNAAINISLKEQAILGQEVVVAASRVEETVMKSPVAVEKMDIRAIRESTSPSFYDALSNMKGVDMTTQGLLFKSINMRGFGATGNPRTVQMIDGMDNQAPGLNFPVDNIVGMPELDVESVELLPGAASALYGPNAINGLILMNSKSPFLYQGLSATVKSGVMSASNREKTTTPFYDLSLRYAKAFNDKFAFKVNLAYITAKDWEATDYTNLNVGGNADPKRGTGTDADYDGVNVYGDETRRVVNGVPVTRTGLLEKDLVDYNTKSFKTNIALHYRINEKVELIGQVNYGFGTTVYTGTGRYALRNFNLTQGKLELRGDNFTLRTYTTQERSGDSYTAGLVALAMQRAVKSDDKWFADYATGGRAAADAGMPAPGTDAFKNLLETARSTSINATDANNKGGGFLDKTNLYHAEGIYNFKNQIKFIELLGGASFRQYQLRSEGTLFSDTKDGRDGTISINEYGAFLQAGKSLFDDHLKLSASLRYDKSKNFEGFFTPRVSAVGSFGQHNIRASYQTGYRIPTTQNQYIDLATPLGILIGGQPEFDTRYNLSIGITQDILADFAAKGLATKYLTDADRAGVTQVVNAALPTIQAQVIAGVQAQVVAAVTAQVQAAVAAGQIPPAQAPAVIAAQVQQQMTSDAIKTTITGLVTKNASDFGRGFALGLLPKYKAVPLQPEKIQSFEIGYKGLIADKLFIDTYFYYSLYNNFIGGTSIVVPTKSALEGILPIQSGIGIGNYIGFSRPSNTKERITANGFGISANYSLTKGYNIGANFAQNNLIGFTASSEQQYAGYNTPKNRYNLSFGKRLVSGSKFGFNINFRHQDGFNWEASFTRPSDATIAAFTNTQIKAINNIDAQVSLKVPSIKSIIKLGGTNIGGKPYVQAFGSASVGSMYYVALSFDELLNK
ncbi:carboxypeptidase-like regulatory domain-containing protein [Emticicia sp. C21]|uniref:TonB-dependent receptor n=1 Tax=Emticicia sp. C21 TaxID=2302915 RepID=UPI000E34A59A|nr:carboxypeptidase-like regulatory domain-containing protein [Emticicia sp. C21]RFS15951.1 TonB-dependent receptor [Emticicia sp. C21]